MGDGPVMRTERLVVRRWREEDRGPFAALTADPEVMEHFPATLTREESDAMVDRLAARIEEDGFGFWALEVAGSGEFIGFTGISRVRFDAPFTPAVEIGWRLARGAWGLGYASEAARAALEFGFGEAGLDEIVSFTARGNLRSQAVMRRIGMIRDPEGDFGHPAVAEGSPLRPHVLYRLAAGRWREALGAG
ncbi:GNAT family N-acetyltransferase [Actinocorallia populi]|uniref:GNAT family N-acetyltransferase n=1 Tax=Actinocorallia populi TaxID=2079200 RepID=UPI001E382B54|nr:GNAT family N-acetyltransferase [Actinocorallia populi]